MKVYLWEDKITILYNVQDGYSDITLDDIKKEDPKANFDESSLLGRLVEVRHSLSFTHPKPYGLAWQNQLRRRDAKDTQKSFFAAKRYMFFNDFSCRRVNDGCRSTDTAHY